MQRIQQNIEKFLSDRPLAQVSPDDPVAAAMAQMKDKDSHSALVLDGDTLVGIFTGRDFLNRVAAPGRDPAAVTMREVMTPDPETLGPLDSIAYAINRMAVRGFRNIPIVDDAQRAIAVLDIRTVTAHLSEVFGDVAKSGSSADEAIDEWTDIGGG